MRVYKKCGKCLKEKLSIEFSKHKRQADGLQPWCKLCNKLNTRVWYKDNNPQHRRVIRERRQSYKENAQWFLIEYLLGHPCVDCEESDPLVLDFDHRDRSTKSFSIGMMMNLVSGTDLSRLKEEVSKCDVRCANCHRRKTAKEANHLRYRLLTRLT